ncbi:TM0106 family RecB-like putative nuclease [Plantibacter sp. YIM 135249]|uniref:TM0106 family RecB-like putative nuclease n=1 Tax=Plantibacter sp. YIM 135249 TaxID=3423918 RepID=UPI003D348F2B
MFLLDGQPVTSASDLSNASYCEFAFLRGIDAKLGHIDRLDEVPDEMLQRTSALGDQHELRVLQRYRDEFGDGVVELERPSVRDAEALAQAVEDTLAAFRSSAPVVFQGAFFDGSFIGFADFIIRRPDGSHRVQDTKLARSPRVTALLQLAAYVEQLHAAGIPTDDHVDLLLGDDTTSTHAVADILPVYRRRRARLMRIVQERIDAATAVEWGDPRYSVCGHCAHCEAEIAASRDVLLVAGLRLTQRDRLFAAGIETIDALAAIRLEDPLRQAQGPEVGALRQAQGPGGHYTHAHHTTEPTTVAGIPDSTLRGLREQARLQIQPSDATGKPPFVVHDAQTIGLLPEPSPGDIFFDFEGDPLYTEGHGNGPHGSTRWGIDYLFGMVDADGAFRAWWAHDFHEERLALEGFLAYLTERRAQYPGMHVYHYAAYERTHLLSLAARHGVGEHVIDDLLRDGVLVDLYPLVRKTLRVGSRSYSIKKLEPLYMGEDHRDGDVTNAAASITEYADARELVRSGDPELVAQGEHKLAEIADYNEYDCESTRRLRDWLLELGAERGVLPGSFVTDQVELVPDEPTPLHNALSAFAGDPLDPERSDDAAAYALAAAAIDYHRREHKTFWQEHFSRLIAAADEWEDVRNVFTVTGGEVERDWFREGKQRSDRRHVRLSGRWAPGSTVKVGGDPFALYEYPGPFTLPRAEAGSRPAGQITILEIDDDGSLLIQETLKADRDPYDDLPMALTPSPPPRPGTQVDAIADWGQRIVDAHPEWPKDGVVDILRRQPPRTRSGAAMPDTGDTIRDVTAALLDLDASYLAVQGPPGTGKTYVASHVIAGLVAEHGWRVGVVAQSHDVVENLLERIVKAGLDAGLVAKAAKAGADGTIERAYTILPSNGHAAFAREAAARPGPGLSVPEPVEGQRGAHPVPEPVEGRRAGLPVPEPVEGPSTTPSATSTHRGGGYVIGGTAWDFSNPVRFDRRQLDLLVVDEAGQFSLAYTIAASVAADNLLLLGDPQQLPQVSQGTHPEPIDTSALGFVADGRDVLPAELGYFLHESWRMDAAVTEPVSTLSYAGELRSAAATARRSLAGLASGLHIAEVHHAGNATHSTEEADRVVEIVRSVVGLLWTNPDDARVSDPLTASDVIVVCPYNAHVAVVRDALDEAGLEDVRVGTVDKFQGQEAVIAIVSLAASSPADVPRGMSFLLLKNRLNVGISRAQWAAFLVHSPALTDYLPTTPDGLAELSAFIRLVDGGLRD